MRQSLAAAISLAVIAICPALAQEHQEYKAGSVRIEAPWIRATPAGAEVAGGYMKLENTGKEPDRLIGGATSVAGKFEVHEMKMDGSVMRMRELPGGLELKPGQSVELKPGSYHLMLMDLKRQLKEGDKVKGTLVFEKAGKVDLEYTVRGMGAKAGGQAGHHGGHSGHGMKH
jgi:copper(I)-binding protein